MKLSKLPFEFKLLLVIMTFYGLSLQTLTVSAIPSAGDTKEVWVLKASNTLVAEYRVTSTDDVRIKSALFRPRTGDAITSLAWTHTAENIVTKSWTLDWSVKGEVKAKSWKGLQEVSGSLEYVGSRKSETKETTSLSNSYSISNDPANDNSWYDSGHQIKLDARFDIRVEEYLMQEKADIYQKEIQRCEGFWIFCSWKHYTWEDEYQVTFYTYNTGYSVSLEIIGQRFVDGPVGTTTKRQCVYGVTPDGKLYCRYYQTVTTPKYSPYYSWLKPAYDKVVRGTDYREDHTIDSKYYDGGTTYTIEAKKAHYEMINWKHGGKGTVKGTWGAKILGNEGSFSLTLSISSIWQWGSGTNEIASTRATISIPHSCTLLLDAWTLSWNSLYLYGACT
ncbi:MAG: hypothetical protein D6732_14215 [Methanobacteriota archaeon]|nr:MAG: hypothetical protein D6732_14215 [Euryarchaeota archaeon]